MIVDTSFIVIDADWTCEHAVQVLSPFADVMHVVVHRVDAKKGEFVYAFAYRDVMPKLHVAPDARVLDALDLHEHTATPTVYSDGAAPPRAAVVLDYGRIAGVAVPSTSIGPGLKGVGPHGLDAVHGNDHLGLGALTSPRDFSARVPSTIELGQRALMLVTIGAAGVQVGTGDTVAVATGDTIDLVVEASGSLALVPPSEISVQIDTDAAIVKRFYLQARELGNGRVIVRAFRGPSQIAMLTLATEVVAAVVPGTPDVERRAWIQEVELPPDLDIVIEEDRKHREYTIKLTAARSQLRLNRVPFGPIRLDADVDTFFTSFYGDIEKILSDPGNAKQKMAALGQLGVYLFERIVPADMRARLWQVRDEIRSIRIQSEEPWVPWELCKLTGQNDAGDIIEDKFIAERYAVTRWFLGVPELRALTMNSIGIVVPPDSGLAAASAERRKAEERRSPHRTVTIIKSDPVELREALASGTYDVLHFVGHGAYQAGDADRSSIKLENGARFWPRDLAGRVSNFRKRAPVVLLNACEVGRSGTTLGGLAGWPQAFVRPGAGAFIAPLWKVADACAAEFSNELYDALLTGKTLGEAVQHARNVIRAADDPTWLAYIAYGHPDARVSS